MKLGAHWNLNSVVFKTFGIFFFFWVFSSHLFLKRNIWLLHRPFQIGVWGQVTPGTVVHRVWGLALASRPTLLWNLPVLLCHTWRHVPWWLVAYITSTREILVKIVWNSHLKMLSVHHQPFKDDNIKDGICPQHAPESYLKLEGTRTLHFWSHKRFLGEEST